MLLFKRIVVIVICFQLCMPQVFASQTSEGSPALNELAESFSEGFSSPQDKEKFQRIMKIADSLEIGNVPTEIEQTSVDLFKIENQTVEFLSNGEVIKTYLANEIQSTYENVGYSYLRPVYNSLARELIFEGVVGVKADGTGGSVVARHIIRNIDMISMKHTNEFLVFVNSSGELSLIDMGYVSSQVFKTPLLVVPNLWKPKNQIQIQQADIRFMTPGTDPLTRDAYTGHIHSRDKNGDPKWSNGDLRLTVLDENNNPQVLALLPRDQLYLKAQLSFAYMLEKMKLFEPDSNVLEFKKKLLDIISQRNLDVEEIPGSYDAVLKQFLHKISPDQIANLKSRLRDNSAYSNRRFGTQTLTEAIANFEEIKANYTSKNSVLDSIDNLERSWYENVSISQPESPFKKSFSDVFQNAVNKLAQEKATGIMMGITASLYIAFPFAYENFETLQQLKTLNWFYNNAYAEVMIEPYTTLPMEVNGETVNQEVNYRKYNILNIVALMMLWPAAHVVAWKFKKVLNSANKLVANSNSKVAVTIRELYSNWSPLSNWQVVTSFGMRVYAKFIYPKIREGLEVVFRQKSLFSSISNHQNPFQIISKNSPMGAALGLEKSMSLGLNNPLASSEKLKQQTELKRKAQALLKEQNLKRSQMAFLLATLTVSEKFGIDPATLIQAQNGKMDLSQLKSLFANEKAKREWFLVSRDVYTLLTQNKSEILDAIEDMPLEEFGDYYQNASEIAERIHSYSNSQKWVSEKWTKFKRLPFFLLNNMPFFSGGVEDYNFLNSIYTNKFVSDQVHKQFYIDHLMVTTIVNLMPGEDGRANYDKPQNLAAHPQGILYASGPHLNDTVMNTYIHFFVSGAKVALVYQAVKAKADQLPPKKENTKLPEWDAPAPQNLVYDPIEDFKYLTQDRQQGFLTSTADWLKSVMTFTQSDLGGRVWKGFKRRVTTFQGGFLTFLIFQMIFISDRALTDALISFGLMFGAAYWLYAWPWDPVQVGNSMIEGRFEEKTGMLTELKMKMLEAMKEENPEVSKELLKKAYLDIFALYAKEGKETLSKLEAAAKLFDPEVKAQLQAVFRSVHGSIQGDKKSHKANKYLNSQEMELTSQNMPSVYMYGLMGELLRAKNANDTQREAQVRKLIIENLNGENIEEVQKLSSKSLFDLALSNSPIFTKPSGILSVATTTGAAILTTVLAIGLLTATTDVVDKPTLEYVVNWNIANVLGMMTVWAATSAKAWNFYIDKYQSFKERVNSWRSWYKSEKKAQPKVSGVNSFSKLVMEKSRSNSIQSCAGYFH